MPALSKRINSIWRSWWILLLYTIVFLILAGIALLKFRKENPQYGRP